MEPRLTQPRAPGNEILQLPETAEPAADLRVHQRSLPELLTAVIPWLVLLIAVALIVVPFWPGRMDADTLNEIYSAKSGIYTNQYSPILEAMWHPFINAGFGPGWILTGQVLVFVVAAFSLVRLALRPLGAAVAVALITLTPMVFGGSGLVGRDQWFLALLVACFAAVARAFATSGTARRLWFAVAVVLAWLTLATRENAGAAVFVPLALLAGMWVVHRWPAMMPRRWALAGCSLLLGIVVTVAMMGSQLLVYSALSVRSVRPASTLFIYDLAALSRKDHKNYFPAGVLANGSLAAIEARSNTDTIAPMVGPGAPITWPLSAHAYSALESAWKHRIIAEPLEWLHERLTMMGDQIALTNDSIWVYHPFIDGSIDGKPNVLGYKTSFRWANDIADGYIRTFTNASNNGDFLFSVWAYLLFSAVVAVWLLRARTWKRLLVGALALSSLTYQPSFLFLGQGSQYRYERPSVAIALILAALAAPSAWQLIRARRALR